jgi:agmatinase
MSQQSAAHYLRHGQIPFFRLSMADLSSGGAAAYRGARAVLLGVPWDGATTHQPGARFAPYHIRRVSALVQGFHPQHEVDVFAGGRILDGGNVAIPPFDAAAVRACIHDEVAAIVEAGAVPFVVGGDHSVALPSLRAIAAAHGPVAVVHVDAHADTSGPEIWGDAFHHGTPIRHILDEKLVADGQLHQVGLRGPWSTREDGRYAPDRGAKIHSIDEIADRGVTAIAEEIRRTVGDRPTYITLDIDAIDPAFAPGTGTPVPGGLTSREALQLLRGLAGVKIVGMDLVEVLPALDVADCTAHLAAHLLWEGLALLAAR